MEEHVKTRNTAKFGRSHHRLSVYNRNDFFHDFFYFISSWKHIMEKLAGDLFLELKIIKLSNLTTQLTYFPYKTHKNNFRR